ncbi:MAG: hypothetical protein AAF519_10905 [Bacteroidota bacterium]
MEIHEIPILAKSNLIKPLGKPTKNGPQYFVTCMILELKEDEVWLNKACKSISQNWRGKNQRGEFQVKN